MRNKDIKNLFLKEEDKIDIKMSNELKNTPIVMKEKITPTHSFKKRWVFAPVGAVAMAFVVAFVLILTQTGTSASALTAYVIEINPSISITTNAKDEVVNICSLNEDANTILSNAAFNDAVGKSLENAIKNIINVANEKGFFNGYDKTIKLYALNDNKKTMNKKLDNFGQMVRNELDFHGFEELPFEKAPMELDFFKEKMGFDNNFQRLDDMGKDIRKHDRFMGDVPPPPIPAN